MPRITKNLIWVLALALVGLFALAACGDDDDNGTETGVGGEFPVTVERSDGRELTIDAAPQRIVSLSAGHSEILFSIGADDQVVAVENFSDYPAAAAAVEVRLDSFEPSVEAIADLEPDLVIIASDQDDVVAALDGLGIPVFFNDINAEITTIEGVFETIDELGLATGHAAEAEELVAGLRERLDAVVEAVADVEDGPRIYHELDATGGFFTVAPGDFVGDLYNKLKAENIVREDEGPYPSVNQEAIIERDPEVILLADAEFGQTVDVVSARPGWDTIAAVLDGRVHEIDTNVFSRPGPRIIDALEELGGLLYPELFPPEESRRCLACSAASA